MGRIDPAMIMVWFVPRLNFDGIQLCSRF